MPKPLSQNRFFAAILVGILAGFLTLILLFTEALHPINSKFSDKLYGYNQPSDDIVLIVVDDKSLGPDALGRFNQWSRENFVKLLKQLENEEPKVITFDFIFNTKTTNISREEILKLSQGTTKADNNKEKLEEYDEFVSTYRSDLYPVDLALAEAFSQFDNIILGAEVLGQELVLPLYEFGPQAKLGIISNSIDDDNVLRHAIPYFQANGSEYDDMAVATVKQYLDVDKLDLPVKDGQMMVNFFAEPYGYRSISFIDVLKGNFQQNDFKDKIVLVGPTSSKEFHDEYLTPVSNSTPMPGIEFRANEIQTILEGKFLANQSTVSQILTIFLIALGLTLLLSYLGIILSLLLTIVTIAAYILLAHLMYRQGLILNMAYPFVAIILSYIGSWVYKYFIADRKKRDLANAFGHYVSKDLVAQISKNPDLVKLGGEKREITVFFSDIQGSTTLSEQIAIEAWVAQINEYFTVMENVLMQSGGTLDKYEGDAIMGFWNAPIAQENHVDRAYIAALTMREALQNLHQKWQKEGKPLIEFRIGLNTGPALVGNFGSENRLDYTVMGDTVNTASRLESSANKAYGTRICVAGGKSDKVILRELDTVLLPGKKEEVQIFELVALANKCDERTKKLINQYAQGLEAYRTKDWPLAISIFQLLPNDSPSQIMLTRCQKLQAGQLVDGLDQNMVFQIEHK